MTTEPTAILTPTPTFTSTPTATPAPTLTPTSFVIPSSGGGGGSSAPLPPPPLLPPSLAVSIMSHEDGALASERLIRINGTVTGQNPMVDMNGVVATISGGEFDAIVNIGEGENTVIATATNLDFVQRWP